ncbi:MAG: pyrimidine operon attenuation protein/uracil phosphoribosyltransferase [Myxococcota bacterium]|jgi:pyrimidine operon attenuation protein/uracil phosphoribosyltransferase
MTGHTELINGEALERTLDRMALQILECTASSGEGGLLEDGGLALVGIHRGGVPLAERLKARLDRHLGDTPVPLGKVDITLYRDDATIGLPQPIVGPTELDFDITGRNLVLVDDVLYTGRTVRAALDALTDFGRPRRILLAVLLDRGHRELPIQPDVVGLTVTTKCDEEVEVELTELGADTDRVVVRAGGRPNPGGL